MRAWLRAEAARLRQSISPPAAERRELAAELLGLFAAFPAQALSDAAAEARARHYLAAMAGFPIAAVRAAIAAWMRGEHAERHDNHAFPPSPPQLARLARIALAPLWRRIETLDALARAEALPPPPSDESRARVAALAEAFRRGATTPVVPDGSRVFPTADPEPRARSGTGGSGSPASPSPGTTEDERSA